MVRLSIEERWWSDPRRSKLAEYFNGDLRQADVAALKLWQFARHYLSQGDLIPYHALKTVGCLNALINCDLAVEQENGFYARGSIALYTLGKNNNDVKMTARCRQDAARKKSYE